MNHPRILLAAAILLPTLALATTALAATSVNERHPVASGGRVEVSNIAGKVTVRGWDRNEVQLTGTLADGLSLEQDRSSNRVRWEVKYPRGRNNGDARLELRVPRAVEVQLGTVSADVDLSGVDLQRLAVNTVSGDLLVGGSAAEATLATVSGDVNAQLKTPRLAARTVSGQLNIGGGATGDVSVESVSGDVGMQTGRVQRVAVESVSGGITIRSSALAAGGSLRAETVSGDVSVQLPASTSAQLRVNSFSGDIRSDAGSVERPRHGPGSRLNTRLGSGDGDVSLESHSGDVRVNLGR